MRILLLALGLLLASAHAIAHNPLSARYHLVGGSPAAVLTIGLSTAGLRHALSDDYGPDAVDAMSAAEYRQAAVDYVRERFALQVGGEPVALAGGGIRAGNHQTDMKFVVPAALDESTELEVHVSAFSATPEHQTIFSYELGGLEGRAILSADNGYSAKISGTGTPPSTALVWFVGAVAASLLVITGLLRLRKTQSTSATPVEDATQVARERGERVELLLPE